MHLLSAAMTAICIGNAELLVDKACQCLQGVFTKQTILSDPDNIRKIYFVDWDDQPGNTDMRYRTRDHWQSITVSTRLLVCALTTACEHLRCRTTHRSVTAVPHCTRPTAFVDASVTRHGCEQLNMSMLTHLKLLCTPANSLNRSRSSIAIHIYPRRRCSQ